VKTRIACLITGLLAASCAIQELPPGGPEDTTPPEVVGTVPARGSAGVPAGTTVAIEFSEKMKKTRFERNIELSPAATVSKARWKKNTFIVEFESLNPDTTYLVKVKSGYADAHNVRSDRTFEFAFATSAQIDTGSISGTVYFRRKPSDKAVVRLFALSTDTTLAPEAARPDRETETSKEGRYEFRYLPARGGSFLLWTFQDANNNSIFDRDGEVGASLGDTLVLTRQRPRSDFQDIYIVDPKEPASITGLVVNATPYDTVPVSLALHEASDSLPPSYYVLADNKGVYTFKSVLKGVYALHAFIDLERDSLCGTFPCPADSTAACPEFCVSYPESIFVSPGDEIQLKQIRLEAIRGGEE
jgi:hypothetical protein